MAAVSDSEPEDESPDRVDSMASILDNEAVQDYLKEISPFQGEENSRRFTSVIAQMFTDDPVDDFDCYA